MALPYNVAPMELGQTLQGTNPDNSSTLINGEKLGQVYEIPYNRIENLIRGNKQRFVGRNIKAVLLRNTSGATLYGKRLVRLDRTAGFAMFQNVDGYPVATAEKLVVAVDPYLETTGVADDDIFWGIIEGPTVVLTSMVGAGFVGDLAAGAELVAATLNSTTGNSDGGRVANVTLPGQTGATAAFQSAVRIVGTALSARTTGETNSDLLVNLTIRL